MYVADEHVHKRVCIVLHIPKLPRTFVIIIFTSFF